MTYNIRIIKIEGKMFSVPSLATTAALTAVQDNTPRISKKNLVKKKRKTDYDAKISDIKSKCCSTSDYNKFTRDMPNAKRKEKELVDESAIAGFLNKADLNKKVAKLLPKRFNS